MVTYKDAPSHTRVFCIHCSLSLSHTLCFLWSLLHNIMPHSDGTPPLVQHVFLCVAWACRCFTFWHTPRMGVVRQPSSQMQRCIHHDQTNALRPPRRSPRVVLDNICMCECAHLRHLEMRCEFESTAQLASYCAHLFPQAGRQDVGTPTPTPTHTQKKRNCVLPLSRPLYCIHIVVRYLSHIAHISHTQISRRRHCATVAHLTPRWHPAPGVQIFYLKHNSLIARQTNRARYDLILSTTGRAGRRLPTKPASRGNHQTIGCGDMPSVRAAECVICACHCLRVCACVCVRNSQVNNMRTSVCVQAAALGRAGNILQCAQNWRGGGGGSVCVFFYDTYAQHCAGHVTGRRPITRTHTHTRTHRRHTI